VYLGMKGDEASAGTLLVKLEDDTEYEYPVAVRAGGISRGVPGKGISEQYLALGYANVDGADFRIDNIQADVAASETRRLK
jgi:hypothetical protein